MADKRIIIRASAATRALAGLADVNETVLSLNIPSANVAAANGILATIDSKEWMSGDTVVETNGNTTADIRLPKKAITG